MQQSSRRQFLKQTSSISLGFIGLSSFLAGSLLSCQPDEQALGDPRISNKYGPVIQDPKGILNLPTGFSYKIIARKGEPMSDGLTHPHKPDGMATFLAPDGQVILVRNHELMPGDLGAFGKKDELIDQLDQQHFYDSGRDNTICKGGTTTLIFNERSQRVERSY
ncbi:MAG: alkaline phosphatase PhoX, partial [Bacteroidota bacterium]